MNRHKDHIAQMYKGGVYKRTLTDDIIPSAPDGEYSAITYRRMGEIVRSLSYGFRDLGVEKGDRVGIFSNTRLEWAQSDFALLGSGAVVTTVYPQSSPHQVEYLLGDSESTGVVVENEELLERVLAVDDLDLEFIVVIDRVDREYLERNDIYTLAEVFERGSHRDDTENWVVDLERDALASLVYTSGTTGKPKGVKLTHWNFRSNLNQIRKRIGPRPDKPDDVPKLDAGLRTLSFLPLAHVFERIAGHFMMFSSGATVAYAESPDTISDDIQKVKPDTVTSVPRVYEKIYDRLRSQSSKSTIKETLFNWATNVGVKYYKSDSPGLFLKMQYFLADKLVFQKVKEAFGGNVDFFVSGGGSLSSELGYLFQGMGLTILEGYGLTETSPVISINPPEQPKVGTLGVPVVDVDIKIDESVVSDDRRQKGDGKIGELLVKGPNVTSGYWNKEAETESTFTDDGWFQTGDIVEYRQDDYMVFRDRLKQIIVLSTGKNVAPQPIEGAFSTSQRINQCMVMGDGEKFISALIVPDFEAIRTWADESDVNLPEDPEQICEVERVNSWIEDEVDRINEDFEHHEQIKEFRLVSLEWTPENDLLTPSMKLKRRNIVDHFDHKVEDIYG